MLAQPFLLSIDWRWSQLTTTKEERQEWREKSEKRDLFLPPLGPGSASVGRSSLFGLLAFFEAASEARVSV